MTEKMGKSGTTSGLEDTKNLGRPADPEIKNQRPQVSDKGKLAGAISTIDDLSARLARLDLQDGPFGTVGTAAGVTMFDDLLDDVDDAPVVAQETVTTEKKPLLEDESETSRVGDSQNASVADDEMLITSLIVDENSDGEDGTLSDLDAIFEEARADEALDQAVPGPEGMAEVQAGNGSDFPQGDDFPEALKDFLDDVEGDEYLGIMDEDIHDPIDDLMDEAGLVDDRWVEELPATVVEAKSQQDTHASPFAALFSTVEIDFEDPGAERSSGHESGIHIEEYDPDDDLFFTPDEDAEIFGSSELPEVVNETTEVDDDDLLDINSSLYEIEDDTGENDASDAISALNEVEEDPIYEDQSGPSDLPELTMGQEESLYAPGTSYEEEEDNSGEVGNDVSEDDDNLQTNEILVEKEDQMTISMNTSGENEEARAEDEKDFTSSDLDDLLGEDDTQDDDGTEGVDQDGYYEDLADENLSDAAMAEFEDDDVAGVDAASLLFDDEDGEGAPVADTSPVGEDDDVEVEAAILTPSEPAKKKKSKTMAMAVVSVSFLAILGGGYAYTNGMLPPIPGVPTTFATEKPVEVAVTNPDRDMSPIIPVEVDKDDLGGDADVAADVVVDLALETEAEVVEDIVADEAIATGDTADTEILDSEVAALLDDVPRNTDKGFEFGPALGSMLADDAIIDDVSGDDGEAGEQPLSVTGRDDLMTDPDELMTTPDIIEPDSDMDVAEAGDDFEYLGEIQLPTIVVDAEAEMDTEIVAAESPIDASDAPENEATPQENVTSDFPEVDVDSAEVTPTESDVADAPSADLQDPEAEGAGTALDGDLIGLAEVLQNEEMQEIAGAGTSDTEAADVSGDETYDPLVALAAEIDAVGKPAVEDEAPAVVIDNSVFVEEERVIAVEETVATLGESLTGVTEEMKKLNKLIIQSLEQDAAVTRRVEINEQSLRTTSAILGELSMMKGSLDQTQVVLLDIAARVGTLEGANPADRQEVSEEIRQMKGEIQKLSANMSIIARMTVNGVTALTAEGASSGNHGVRTTTAKQPSAGNDMVFSNGEAAPAAPKAPNIPKDVAKHDYVEGYGYVLDVVPASGGQKLVVMENGSALIPD